MALKKERHLIRKKKKESFTAYAQAVKFMRDSWKLWENYGLVAVEVGSIFQALDAARKVLDVTNYKRTGVRLLDRITQYLEESSSNSHSAVIDGEYCANKNFTDSCIYSVNKLSNSEPNEGMSPEKRQMVKLLGNILEEGSDLWKDGDRFRRFADALLELCKIYIILSSSIGSHHQQLLSAERELQSAIKQARYFIH
ncbi:Tetratricopeptide-like helical [Corchorus olitorius]|uniref:Tetratricopeptide-like helical n=1 Tax=Corchorus olitorius TaxID=93759 RepID=A0A1R3JS16_9ROSI|nr:Tetratricopeptide-like helical [Corchorus olitorius]